MKRFFKNVSLVVLMVLFTLVAFSFNNKPNEAKAIKVSSEANVMEDEFFAKCFKCETCITLPDGSRDCSDCVEIECPQQ
ncbi:MAG: hypothetical protein U1C58_12145 [Flavobacteriaceae bacterium]|nr:hypothetical protein [Flavobacteriaceae bacterium]MDZ4149031.1 hypothetical protein [Flavobacteriaceae bacterium]